MELELESNQACIFKGGIGIESKGFGPELESTFAGIAPHCFMRLPCPAMNGHFATIEGHTYIVIHKI